MKTRIAAALLILLGLSAGSLFAQKYEVDTYAGGFFPTTSESVGRFRNEGIYGVRGGRFVGEHFEIAANFNYLAHFDLKSNNPLLLEENNAGIFRPSVHAIEYGALFRYNFSGRRFFGPRITPYASAGIGALTALVSGLSTPALVQNNDVLAGSNTNATASAPGFNGNSVFLGTQESNTRLLSTTPFGISSVAGRSIVGTTNPGFVLTDGDSFLTLTYGFGIKALSLWGPVGLNLDVAGHTMPNFFGHQMSWPQATAGLTFSWGER